MISNNYNLTVQQGASFSLLLTIQNADGRLDLTGYVFRGQIRTVYPSPVVQANFSFNVLDQTVPLTKGQVVITIPASQTQTIDVSGIQKGQNYVDMVYDVESQNGAEVIRWIQGTATILAEVTR